MDAAEHNSYTIDWSKVRRNCWHWTTALARSVVQGTATSIKAAFAAGAANGVTQGAVPSLSLATMGGIAGAAAIYNAVDFLSKNPLPDDDDDPASPKAPNT